MREVPITAMTCNNDLADFHMLLLWWIEVIGEADDDSYEDRC